MIKQLNHHEINSLKTCGVKQQTTIHTALIIKKFCRSLNE